MGLTKKQKTWIDEMKAIVGKIKQLPNAASMPGFDQLKTPIQSQILEVLAARPDDTALAKNIGDLVGGSNFKGLPEPRQTFVLKLIKQFGSGRKKIENLVMLINDIMAFDAYPEESQKMVLEVFASKSQDTDFVKNVMRTVQSLEFSRLNPSVQNDLLLRIRDMPSDPTNVDNLVKMIAWKGFDGVDYSVQNEILEKLPTRYSAVPLTPAMMKNVMELATATGFKTVKPEIREFAFDQLSARPENAQLATEFRALVEKGALFDTRNARKYIMDADDKTP